MRKLTQTKELGLKKKMIDSSPISAPTARAAGAPFPRPPVFSAAERAAAYAGSIT